MGTGVGTGATISGVGGPLSWSRQVLAGSLWVSWHV